MTGRIDELSSAIGEVRANVRELQRRSREDRDVGAERHSENQEAMADLRSDTQSAISELRESIRELRESIRELREAIKKNGTGALTTTQRAALITIAVAFLGALAWLAEMLFGSLATWIISHIKFGG